MPLQTHRIEIDAAQLDWYCDEVEEASMIPFYYVLSQPPWTGAASSRPVPEQAAGRVTSDAGPFPQWAYVSPCTDLRRELSGRRSIDTDQLPLPGGMTLAEFFQDVRHGKAGKWLSPDDEDAQRPHSPAWLAAEPQGTRQNPHIGSAISVFLPFGNLANEDS